MKSHRIIAIDNTEVKWMRMEWLLENSAEAFYRALSAGWWSIKPIGFENLKICWFFILKSGATPRTPNCFDSKLLVFLGICSCARECTRPNGRMDERVWVVGKCRNNNKLKNSVFAYPYLLALVGIIEFFDLERPERRKDRTQIDWNFIFLLFLHLFEFLLCETFVVCFAILMSMWQFVILKRPPCVIHRCIGRR